ncbi:hypothetical protein QBC36DRAFT_316273 [Triangularia setosa]|uniref:Uncharacterized protein n=1 Tax=Triangularia setosa TaxID=2587417 RepID=A0AAN6VWE8_9PEZI|nr:hypothetical protein QBC36DRAFT_316273 [Podospora setosa]
MGRLYCQDVAQRATNRSRGSEMQNLSSRIGPCSARAKLHQWINDGHGATAVTFRDKLHTTELSTLVSSCQKYDALCGGEYDGGCNFAIVLLVLLIPQSQRTSIISIQGNNVGGEGQDAGLGLSAGAELQAHTSSFLLYLTITLIDWQW